MKNSNLKGNQKRIKLYSEYFRINFGGRVQKLAIDAGFTCPNRDGSKGTGGCTFCNNAAFNPSYCKPEKTISQQLSEGIEFHRIRYRRAIGYLAYFQAYSNTYAPLERLKSLYEEALSFPGIMGLVIGTRPDCVNDELLDYLAQLSEKTYLILEFGIESCHNKTLRKINRGHSFETTVDAIEKSHSRRIKTGGHMIIGLPGENEADVLKTVRTVSALPLNTIKFHQLQIIEGTKIAEDFKRNPARFRIFNLIDYLDLMTQVICLLNPDFYVERIAGEASPRYNLNPSWGLRYDQILLKFEKILEEKDAWQGKLFIS